MDKRLYKKRKSEKEVSKIARHRLTYSTNLFFDYENKLLTLSQYKASRNGKLSELLKEKRALLNQLPKIKRDIDAIYTRTMGIVGRKVQTLVADELAILKEQYRIVYSNTKQIDNLLTRI
jgi:hypothetical protein